MDKLKKFILKYFEQFFVVCILFAIIIINYLIPAPLKLTFINFYFLPVIAAGIYLGMHSSVLGAVFCFLLVAIYQTLYPHEFILPSTGQNLILHILAWGGFLVLAGAVVGRQQEKLNGQIKQTQKLNERLQQQQAELHAVNEELQDYSDNLEAMVQERTGDLVKANESVEKLKSKLETTLYATMDSSVVKLLIEGRLRNEKRMVSVMFSDLVGFTAYSEERTPELVVRDLNRYLNDMEPIFLDYHGHIDKYIGDGIMCEFGAPLDFENFRLLAVIAAIKMQEKMKRLNYPWQMRIGICSGNAITGLIGSRRQSYTSIGDVVNLASRFEKACPPGTVLIDDFTKEGVERFVNVRLKKSVGKLAIQDITAEARLEKLLHEIQSVTDRCRKAEMYYQLGQLHVSLGEFQDALECYEEGMKEDPENLVVKVAFADLSVKQEEFQKIEVRGKKQRVAAYEILGIRDVLLDREKIPASFYNKYKYVPDLLSIPDDVILPVEALDGSIGHSRVVAVISFAIAEELNIFTENEKLEILHAAFVADIGKQIVPHHLLNRTGGLSTTEIQLIRKHPAEGIKVLKKMGYESEQMLQFISHSHEKYDGSGYPEGLQGEIIPKGSSIIAVADAYDAMTSWRPYREKLVSMVAFDELKKEAEKGILDPEVVRCLINLLN